MKADIRILDPFGCNHVTKKINGWYKDLHLGWGWVEFVSLAEVLKAYLDKEGSLKIETLRLPKLSLMAIPIHLLDNFPPESSEEKDSEVSMEDETSEESENTNGESEIVEPNEEEFWVKYPYLKKHLVTLFAEYSFSQSFFLEMAKNMGDENAKKKNDIGKALFVKEVELCKERCDVVVSTISVIQSRD
ncbi:hypothetical protein AALP_AA6G126000 [Arabis alpina]|uniref:MATH domain-containing protein n=1 Tax=Arabis alpina TaxID=50452 RepID=A0A087GNU1_ARAAL|nr:hypothetical protein AALP_AA6G126000 [Arabis alpina]